MTITHSAARRGSRPPLRNRVTPFGNIVSVPERGTMMGNRGILHDAAGRLRRRYASQLWIRCLLEFRGRRDPVMAPGHYTRLFFLDEPTALAAGHRPCAYCRRAEYNAFRSAWAAANADLGLGPSPRATEIDRVLHVERLGPGGSKRLHPAELSKVPDGTVITPYPGDTRAGRPVSAPPIHTDGNDSWIHYTALEDAAASVVSALLLWRGELWRWSPGGYQTAGPARPGPVLTLTPPSIVRALAAGYRPGPPAFQGAPTPTI